MVNASQFETAPVGLAALDREGVVVWANAWARERCGLEPGGRLAEAFEDGGEALVELGRVIAGERGLEVLGLRVIGGGGAVDLVAARADGGAVCALTDASRRVALEEELGRVRGELAVSERARSTMHELQQELASPGGEPEIIGTSAAVLRMKEQVRAVAGSTATVLIHGETGSGKELVARSIHALSARAGEALVSVNCAAIPESLLESELFGHERGAFTGADRQKLGKFELAHNGTLFLDEVAELSAQAQAKLLRVLQEGTFERVGGTETVRVDVRVVAATHRDLAEQVEKRRFREDLYYRLNVFKLVVPALRDRRDDIKDLVEFLHERHALRMARKVLPVSDRSVRKMMAYRWPGNIRELENAVERATLLSGGPELEIEIPDSPGGAGGGGSAGGGGGGTGALPRDVLLDLTHDQLQRLQIMHALETRGYKVFGEDGAAAKLGLNPQTLLSRMDKLGIPRPRAMRAAMRGE